MESSSSKKRKLPSSQPEDGFADAMSKILAQSIGESASVPVMAKRTTETMRQIDESREEAKLARQADSEKRQRAAKNMVIPDHTTTGFEKQLKKIATSGGAFVFLFLQPHPI